jgi:hypothetical protein
VLPRSCRAGSARDVGGAGPTDDVTDDVTGDVTGGAGPTVCVVNTHLANGVTNPFRMKMVLLATHIITLGVVVTHNSYAMVITALEY